MENASKALIIAGAILLSILIIGLGMAVYNQSDVKDSANLDTQEIQAHNSKFLQYEGKVRGSILKNLINAIRTNNRDYTDRIITITDSNVASTVATKVTNVTTTGANVATDPQTDYAAILGKIKDKTTYFVTFGYMDNGCIGGVEYHIWSEVD